jgi:hypothetical protein
MVSVESLRLRVLTILSDSATAYQSSECLWNLKDLQDRKDPGITHDCDGWYVGNRLWLPLLARASGTSAQKKLSWGLERTVRSPDFPVAPSPVRLSQMPVPGVDSAAWLRNRLRRSQSPINSWFFEVFEVFVVRFWYATASLQRGAHNWLNCNDDSVIWLSASTGRPFEGPRP